MQEEGGGITCHFTYGYKGSATILNDVDGSRSYVESLKSPVFWYFSCKIVFNYNHVICKFLLGKQKPGRNQWNQIKNQAKIPT